MGDAIFLASGEIERIGKYFGNMNDRDKSMFEGILTNVVVSDCA